MNSKVFGLWVLVAWSGYASAQTYYVTDLGTLGGTASHGAAINSTGQVTGQASTSSAAYHAFLYTNGAMSDLGTLGQSSSDGQAINDAGQITGQAATSPPGTYGAFLYSDGTMTDLSAALGAAHGGVPGGAYSLGNGINGAGQVVGQTCPTTENCAAFLYSNGMMTNLGSFGGPASSAQAINDAGQIAGWSYLESIGGSEHAFLYANGTLTDLGTFGGPTSYGYAINSAGEVTGVAYTANDATGLAFLYSNGTMTDLGALGGKYVNSAGRAINDAGQVVGVSAYADNSAGHAFLYSNGKMRDINSLIDSNSIYAPYVTFTDAAAINNNGWIVADGIDSRTGNTHAYLLKTVLMPVSSSISAPANATTGTPFTLSWQTSDASSCNASGGGADGTPWNSRVAIPSGQQTITPTVTGKFTYTLTCVGEITTDTKMVQVTVDVTAPASPPPSGAPGESSNSGGGGAFDWFSLGTLALGGMLGSRRSRRQWRTVVPLPQQRECHLMVP